MGKKQHSKDRMFITKTEWATEWGGAKNRELRTPFKRLPFYCCALTFTPFKTPVCTADGSIFEIMYIVPYIVKYGKHPVTGTPLKQEDLIPLNFHKNSEEEFHCPVLNKVFTEFTHIVAIKTTGNVFCYEAVKELNIKTKNWKELITDEPFTRNDLITLQKMTSDPTYNINVSGDIKQMLEELGTDKAKEAALHGGGGSKARNERAAALAAILSARSRIKDDSKDKAKPPNGFSVSRYTTGAASRSFTSTCFTPVTQNEYEYVKVERNPKKKGYVQLHTTHGDLNIELHCDITPRACENFITLCEQGYYNGVVFHRSIRNFMIQGGDPTGTGKGGESIWGQPFNDELNSKLVHSGRGVVSMANNGPHTNGSQFFILYKSANHLNFKHTVFGNVVGGLTALAAMEKVPVDDDDRPLEEIKITKVTVFVNPYTEPDEEEEEKAKAEEEANDEDKDKVGSWYSNPGTGTTHSEAGSGTVGKYLKARNAAALTESAAADLSSVSVGKKRKASGSAMEFKDFSGW
ncbi:Peptidyl-prolyl cis-trans isomerase CYP65 [Linum perenne]